MLIKLRKFFFIQDEDSDCDLDRDRPSTVSRPVSAIPSVAQVLIEESLQFIKTKQAFNVVSCCCCERFDLTIMRIDYKVLKQSNYDYVKL